MNLYQKLEQELAAREQAGLRKREQVVVSAQGPEIRVSGIDKPVLNFCSNNYLGLANHPRVVAAASEALEVYGFGLASVRFICGTQDIHRQLEKRLAEFLGTEDCLLYTSCFDANGGLFASLLGEEDAIVSARLNHASIIDGSRLARARRHLYREDDPGDLGRVLAQAAGETSGTILVVTDGVFSMEGTLAPLAAIAPLCREAGALLAVDDSHATGLIGPTGAGTPEHCGVSADILTGTLGKALGGASGGYTAGRRILIDWLRNTSRPYLFSNSLPPALAAGATAALDIVRSPEGERLRRQLHDNSAHFRAAMREAGFDIGDTAHPIVPIMTGDAGRARRLAGDLLAAGIYVTAFSYPVVPRDQARVRVQLSARHTAGQIEQAVAAFAAAGDQLGLRRKKTGGRPAGAVAVADQPRLMSAWVYHNRPQADGGRLARETLPVPRPWPGELQLKVLGVSVCGTDEDLFRGKFSEVADGFVPGHEIYGEITALGSNTRGFRPGQRVVVESHYRLPGYLEEGIIGLWGPKIRGGGYLRPLNGGYAEYLAVPAYCAHLLPPSLAGDSEFHPSLLEGVGNDCLVARRLLEHNVLDRVAVVGCGPHGLFIQLFARHFGARRLAAFEIDPQRRQLALSFGADAAIDAAAADRDRQVAAFTGGRGFSAVVDSAGGRPEVLQMCLDMVAAGGTLILFGLYNSEAVRLNGVPADEIIFTMQEMEVDAPAGRIRVQGVTGREGIWEYLIDAVTVSRPLRRKIVAPATLMGPLDNLAADTRRQDARRPMKRVYAPFTSRHGKR